MSRWFLVLLALLLPDRAVADDGSWSRTYDLHDGPLYDTAGHPDIALDRELLVLGSVQEPVVTAVFQFRNTAAEPRVVEAAFPVELHTSLGRGHLHRGRLCPDTESNPKQGQPVWLYGFAHYANGLPEGEVDTALLDLAGIPWTKARWREDCEDVQYYSAFYTPLAGLKPGRVERPVPAKVPFEFRIEQDGQPVALTSVVAEVRPKSGPTIAFHLRHQLKFAPGATSVVKITYRAQVLSGQASLARYGFWGRDNEYTWHYVLRTGATWKGPLGQLVLLVPHGGELVDPAAGKRQAPGRGVRKLWPRVGQWQNWDVHVRGPFEPGQGDDLVWQSVARDSCHGEVDTEVERKSWAQLRTKSKHLILLGGTPGAGKPRKTVTAENYATSVPADVTAAFDGLDVSAWCPAGATPTDAWAEFELKEPATGLRVLSGRWKHRCPHWDAKTKRPATPPEVTAQAQVRGLRLTHQASGRTWELTLRPADGEFQAFGRLLPAGRYRLQVTAVSAAGPKGNGGPCLAEIEVQAGRGGWLEALRQDTFFAPFFVEP